jgi:hypothetical protein
LIGVIKAEDACKVAFTVPVTAYIRAKVTGVVLKRTKSPVGWVPAGTGSKIKSETDTKELGNLVTQVKLNPWCS